MRVFVVGATGQLGRELAGLLPRESTTAVGSAELDVRDGAAVRTRIAAARPDAVVNVAAYNRVDDAERDPEAARAVNALGAEHVAHAAAAVGAFVVHTSTDYVFDGRTTRPYVEDDLPAPLGAYGRSKLEGEQRVAATAPRHALVRVAALYALGGSRGKGGSFIDRILAQADRGEPPRVVRDQVTAPTWARDVAVALVRLLPRWVRDEAPPGPYHVTNGGACSWWEFARAALEIARVDVAVEPITTAELASLAPRPAYSVLANARLAALGEPPLRPWRDALAAYLAAR